jgi:small conductance mechanosensitive channel
MIPFSDIFAAAAAEPASFAVDALWAQILAFAADVQALKPEQIALRAGLSLLAIVAAFVALMVVGAAVKAVARRVSASGQTRRLRLIGWALAIARIAAVVAATLLIVEIWGLNLERLASGPAGKAFAAVARVALIVALLLAAAEIAQLAIHGVFERVASRAQAPRRAAQLRTLGPVVGGVVTVTLLMIAAMMVLSEFGVEIGPLLAGAGVVGLAVGFGAQTLVKDFLTGLFLIMEDSMSIGDVVRIGDNGGLVEEMTMRTVKLRDYSGTLHIIPYGEAQIVHNLTKNFSYYVFDLSISYSSDIANALDLIRTVGAELQADPAYKGLILEPIEVAGVDKLADSGVTLKARFKTLPGKQWTVGREYLKRIKMAFDANGVEIPFPHLTLVNAEPPLPREPQKDGPD